MAIDSAAKRKAVSSIPGLPFAPSVTPDATKAVFWRQTVGWGYGGIAAAAPGINVAIRAVVWETLHSNGVVWDTTLERLVEWESLHEKAVEWEA